VTTAPVLGQPGRAFPVASHGGRTGWLAVPLACADIAVEDFGTGWSSLAHLVGMPVDVLEMDQYFLAAVEHDPARRAMGRAVLQLGSGLGPPVVVEGVPDEAVLTPLRDMGHRYLQGYVFARSLEATQLAAGAWDIADVAALPGAPS